MTAGPNNATVATSTAWSNPTQALVSDHQRSLSNSSLAPIILTGFGFAIPAGATITGVAILAVAGLFVANVTLGVYYPLDVSLTLNGATPSPQFRQTAGAVLGSASDLFGYTSLTPAQVNSSNFGLYIVNDSAVPTQLDFMGQVVIYYTTGTGGTGGTGGGTGGGSGGSGGGTTSHHPRKKMRIIPGGLGLRKL